MKIFDSFFKIAEKYSVIFFDAYGVLKNSTGILQGVADTLARLKKSNIEYYVITNDASRSPEQMARAYEHPIYGDIVPAEKNISSGLLAKEFLTAKVKEGTVAYIGKESAAFFIESAGLTPLPISKVTENSNIKALALLDDEGFDWYSDINKAVNLLRKINIPVIVANTDLAYPVNSHEVSVAVGSLANIIENIIQKTFIRFGKPDTQIFSFALAQARRVQPELQKKEILMVGDTLHTDILGANKFGIDTALVLSGNTQKERVKVLIESSGIIPTYVCESVIT